MGPAGRTSATRHDLERITVHARFHAAHRLRGIQGECRFVHGTTWHGTIVVTADALPGDDRDRSLLPDVLEGLLTQFDHRLIATAADRDLMGESAGGDGVVTIEGRTPTAENISRHVASQVDALIRARFPGRGACYGIEVALTEQAGAFEVSRDVVV